MNAMLASSGLLAWSGGDFWMPDQASTFAHEVDWVFHFVNYVSIISMIIVLACTIYFCIRYRRRSDDDRVSGPTHNTPLELAWSIIPSIFLVPMFWYGFDVFMDSRTPPADTYDITVNAWQWQFNFVYPNGHSDTNLYVPLNRPVRLIMHSTDVIHALFIPAFRVKRDIVPNRISFVWFEAKQPTPNWRDGEGFRLFCAEYCGTSHSTMNANVYVLPQDQFDEWLRNADPLSRMTREHYDAYLKLQAAIETAADAAARETAQKAMDAWIEANKDYQNLLAPVKMGESLFRKRGCITCHQAGGVGLAGQYPPLKGKFGTTETLTTGATVVVDENYIRESILEPGAKIVKGYGNNMAKIPIKDREIDMLIAYIKSLKE